MDDNPYSAPGVEKDSSNRLHGKTRILRKWRQVGASEFLTMVGLFAFAHFCANLATGFALFKTGAIISDELGVDANPTAVIGPLHYISWVLSFPITFLVYEFTDIDLRSTTYRFAYVANSLLWGVFMAWTWRTLKARHRTVRPTQD